MQLQGHLHVLPGGQEVQQLVQLEDEADVPLDLHQALGIAGM
jgi:hypothetical protein